jgi:hypothetical protein
VRWFRSCQLALETSGQGINTNGCFLLLDASITCSLATLIALKPRSVIVHGFKLVVLSWQLVHQFPPVGDTEGKLARTAEQHSGCLTTRPVSALSQT